MKEELLQEIAEYTKTAGNVVVEAAHIYADQEPNGEQSAGALVAHALLEVIKAPTHNLLFVDDFHTAKATLDIEAYQQWLAELGYPIDQTIKEATLVPDAHKLVDRIKQIVPGKKLSPKKPDGSKSLGLWVPGGRKVSLLTQEGKPSCNLLDASFYLKKAEIGEVSLTVLPKCYLPQQIDTIATLQRIGHNSPIINVFFDPASPLESMSIGFSGGIN
jgi:hypothetical protein